MWRKRDIQKRCGQQAHRKKIRISRICAWNTSRLAFDGSGKIDRDIQDHRLCTFQNGKRYNCDLSASYNIGARYFIREILKPLPATERSLLEAKVPAVKRRTSCVYADLRDLISEMELQKQHKGTGRYTVDYLLCGDLPYPSWKKRVSAQDLRNRRIRRYFVCRLKRSEARDFSHVRFTLCMIFYFQLFSLSASGVCSRISLQSKREGLT